MCVLLSSLKIGPVLTKPDLTRWQLFETHCIMRFAFLVSGIKAFVPCNCTFTTQETNCLKPVSSL